MNTVPFGASFLNTVFDADRMLGAAIARPMFRVVDERLALDTESSWPIGGAPRETPHGAFPADSPFLSGGVDVFVMGSAHAPNDRAVPELTVGVTVGSAFTRSIRVIGDRVWRAKAGTGTRRQPLMLEPTPPVPFVTMPLTYERAFGGKADGGATEYAYPPNPAGRGLYSTAEAALDNPLPNLEDPDAPIQSIDDHPEPVGTAPYPANGSLRPLSAVDLHLDAAAPANTRIRRMKPLFFNTAHPNMVIPPHQAPSPGEMIEVTNVGPSGSIRFVMPDMAMHAHVQLEDRQYVFPLHLDQIGILTEEVRVFLSFRAVFTYRVVPLERRRTTLHRGAAPDPIPASHAAVWEDGP